MNPIFQSIVATVMSHKAVCPKCKRSQIVASRKKLPGNKCKFCGENIPPDKNKP